MDVFSIQVRPKNGTITGTAPLLVYQPKPGFTGMDFLTYVVNDGNGDSLPITVTIFVTSEVITKPPSCNPVSVSVQINEEIEISLTGTDPAGTPLSFKIITTPTLGSLDAAKGALPATITYTALDTPGSDSFVFVSSNGTFNSDPCEVSITLTAVPTGPPTCAPLLTAGVSPGDSIEITLVGEDPGDLSMEYLVISGPSQGTLAESDPAQVRNYTADISATGSDVFTYQVRNSAGLLSDPCDVSIPIAVPVGNVSNVVYFSSSECSNTSSTIFDINFDTDFVIPSNGKICIDFSGHTNIDISGVTTISASGLTPGTPVLDGSFAISAVGSVLELSRSGGTATAAGVGFTIGISPITTGDLGIYTLGLEIKTVDDQSITGASVSINSQEFSPCVVCPSLDIGGFAYPRYQTNISLAAPDAGCGSNHWRGNTTICSIDGGSNLVDPDPAGCGFGIEGSVTETNPVFPQHIIDAFSILVCPDDNIGPTCGSFGVITEEGDAVSVDLVANDPNGQPLIYVITTDVSFGVLIGSAPNLTYLPNPGFVGFDEFTYKVSDGFVDSSECTVSIEVTLFVPAVPPETLDVTKFFVVIAEEDFDSITIT